MRLASQPVHQRCVHSGPLVLGAGFLKSAAPTEDRDQTVSRRFKPNQHEEEETSLFGSIRLTQDSSMNAFHSQILKGEQQMAELMKLCEFSPSDKWSLLYRATRDGFGGRDFHSRCDGRANTLTILKAKQSSYIFGGFTAVSWDSSSDYKSDPNAFIFSLINKHNRPLKMKCHNQNYAIYCSKNYGPKFGYDFYIGDKSNKNKTSYSNLGHYYTHPDYAFGSNEAESFLAGSFNFQVEEIEVYTNK